MTIVRFDCMTRIGELSLVNGTWDAQGEHLREADSV